jgi:hypothetical protein
MTRPRSAVLLPVLLCACYTYRPLEGTGPAPGDRVSAQLTTEGSRDLTGQIGPEVLHVEGSVLQADSSGMELAVHEIETYRGFRSGWHGEHVRLPREALAGMQQRRLSIGGTGLLAGVVTAGLVLAYQLLSGSGSSEGATGQPGGPGR